MRDFDQIFASDSIIQPNDFAQKSGQTEEDAKETLMRAVEKGYIEPIYALKDTGPLKWTQDLLSLRHMYKTATGETLDGANPRNVLVAFRRMR